MNRAAAVRSSSPKQVNCARLSVIAHRDGTRTLNTYRRDDPDECAMSAKLTAGEAEALTDALMPAPHSPNLLSATDLGPVAERIELSAHADWNGRVLGETRMRTETGASIVAVLRRAGAWTAITPWVFHPASGSQAFLPALYQ
ncbi:potassium transporter TrkA [Streptomyces sp. NPDC046685]|uniref:potassium transporter TrkA n=1 Tax=Streptomyces sp. NPDC046685 TaxID=3157202 RepID=UPI0033F4A841